MRKFTIHRAPEYRKWFEKQDLRSQLQIEKRLSKIELEGHFGISKPVDDYVFELKWENGRRIYYAYMIKQQILLLLGGSKHGQSKDIAKAKKILEKNTNVNS